jgi:quercetin dioxygenase-like cupin family protein
MKTIRLNSALKTLKQLSEEIRYTDCFKNPNFTAGLIAFRPKKNADSKQITHSDRDVVCQVLKGSGRLRTNGERTPLRPGVVCHIPKGTPHDFAAGRNGELVLFYFLIKT